MTNEPIAAPDTTAASTAPVSDPTPAVDWSQRAEILRASDITKKFGGLVAVREADLIIPEGAIISLIGPNGAGKTTFFNIVAGIIDPTSGEITFRGERMIARPIRGWLEPVLWFVPSAIALAVGAILSAAMGSTGLE